MDWVTLAFVTALTIGVIYLLHQTWQLQMPKREKQADVVLSLRLDQAGEDEPARTKAYAAYWRALRGWNVMRVVSYVFVIAIGLWVGFGLRSETPQTDWDQQDAFTAGWNAGWSDGCETIFAYSPRAGTLYYGDRAYTADWCRGLNQEKYLFDFLGALVPRYEYSADLDSYRSQGYQTAATTALWTVFAAVPELCYGTECINGDTVIEDNAPPMSESYGYYD